MIQIQNLQKTYKMDNKSFPILHIANLKIEHGEQVAITGPSGCGKSTLLHIIGGVIEHDEGVVMLDEITITDLTQSERDQYRRKSVGYVFQDFHLIPSLTAEENIKLVLTGMTKKAQQVLIDDWFEKVGLGNRKKHLPSQLSRGQQQRVAIIRAFITQPELILADEPTGSLDYETAQSIMELLLTLSKDQKQTLICVTHDRTLATRFPKQIEMESINVVMKQKEVKFG